MKKALKVLVALIAVLMTLNGINWIVDPAAAAAGLGMPLLDGVGRSSQIGDMTAFFLTLSSCLFIALISGNRVWFYPPIMLVGIAAVVRTFSWLMHDAAFAVDMIAVEVILAGLFLFASRKLADAQ
jgi:hypothetical protein